MAEGIGQHGDPAIGRILGRGLELGARRDGAFDGGIDVVDSDSFAILDRLRRDATLDDTIGADRVGSIFRDRAGVVVKVTRRR